MIFKENLNFIINSFQIKHCPFKRMAAKSSRNIGKNGSARRNFWPEPSPLKFAGRNGPAQFVKPEIYNLAQPDFSK